MPSGRPSRSRKPPERYGDELTEEEMASLDNILSRRQSSSTLQVTALSSRTDPNIINSTSLLSIPPASTTIALYGLGSTATDAIDESEVETGARNRIEASVVGQNQERAIRDPGLDMEANAEVDDEIAADIVVGKKKKKKKTTVNKKMTKTINKTKDGRTHRAKRRATQLRAEEFPELRLPPMPFPSLPIDTPLALRNKNAESALYISNLGDEEFDSNDNSASALMELETAALDDAVELEYYMQESGAQTTQEWITRHKRAGYTGFGASLLGVIRGHAARQQTREYALEERTQSLFQPSQTGSPQLEIPKSIAALSPEILQQGSIDAGNPPVDTLSRITPTNVTNTPENGCSSTTDNQGHMEGARSVHGNLAPRENGLNVSSEILPYNLAAIAERAGFPSERLPRYKTTSGDGDLLSNDLSLVVPGAESAAVPPIDPTAKILVVRSSSAAWVIRDTPSRRVVSKCRRVRPIAAAITDLKSLNPYAPRRPSALSVCTTVEPSESPGETKATKLDEQSDAGSQRANAAQRDQLTVGYLGGGVRWDLIYQSSSHLSTAAQNTPHVANGPPANKHVESATANPFSSSPSTTRATQTIRRNGSSRRNVVDLLAAGEEPGMEAYVMEDDRIEAED